MGRSASLFLGIIVTSLCRYIECSRMRWHNAASPAITFAFRLALFTLPAVDTQGTIFSVLMKPSANPQQPSPQEYFDQLQLAFSGNTQQTGGASSTTLAPGATLAPGQTTPAPNNGVFGPNSGFTFLSQVTPGQDFSQGVITLQECDLDPFWEKGKIVTDLKYCPLSMVKVVVYAMVPTSIMFFGLIGLWSRQRNVGGRGKETNITSMMALGLTLLSASYDWFFCWELFRNPRPGYQLKVSEFGLAHLIACAALNFLLVHFWFRRKFLVGMPWYEYHKHGFGLHIAFAIMYAQPQAVSLFRSRLFNNDLFNIHFGTPSKMNEVLSHVSCLGLLEDIPQFILQMSVWMADDKGRDAPKVSRVSMALTCISAAMMMKRMYIAQVERQWYKEIVKMAGVKRLSVYGGASRWLKFQKRPSAAKDVKSASTSQQQLFLAWMQSMGRRQESIFDNEENERRALDDGSDSEDSEDEIDDVSTDEEDELSGGEGSESGDEDGESEEEESEDGLSSEGGEEEEDGEVTLQSYDRRRRGKRRPADEESPFGRRRAEGSPAPSDSESGILGFARGVADDISGTSAGIVSESDIFNFARGVAGKASESGVITESSGDLNARNRSRRARRDARERAFAGADDFNESGSGVLGFARGVADDVSAAGTSDTGGSDIFGFARKVARGADGSESGFGASSAGGSDIWKFAQQAADAVSGVSGATDGSDIFAFARGVANKAADGDTSTIGGDSDMFAWARRAAREAASQSGVSAGTTDVGSDIFALAQRAAENVSQSGVALGSVVSQQHGIRRPKQRAPVDDASSIGGSDVSDIFQIAKMAADNVSESAAGSNVTKISDIFAIARGAADNVSGITGQSDAESDIFLAAQRAAGQVSTSGVDMSQSGIRSRMGGMDAIFAQVGPNAAVPQRSAAPSEASSAGSDIFAAARAAAQDMSNSGVGSRSSAGIGNVKGHVPAANRKAPDRPGKRQEEELESNADSEVDIFEAVKRRAEQMSQSGIQSAVGGNMRNMDNIFSKVGVPAPQPPPAKQGKPPVAAKAPAPPAQQAPDDASAVSSGFDLLAVARGAADQTSRSGIESRSQIASQAGGIAGLFTSAAKQPPQQQRAAAVPKQQPRGREAASDILAFAQGAADDLSQSGASGVSGADSDIYGLAHRAAEEVSQSGADSGSDIFGAALRAADGMSQSGVGSSQVGSRAGFGMNDIFAVARGAAGDASDAGSASQSGAGSDFDIFGAAHRAAQAAAPAQRQFNADGRHASAPPLFFDQVELKPEDPNADQPPWAVHALHVCPSLAPPKSLRRPPSPPGTPPPFDSIPKADVIAQLELPTLPPMASVFQSNAVAAPMAPPGKPKGRMKQRPSDKEQLLQQQRPKLKVEESKHSPPAGDILQFAREVAAAAGPLASVPAESNESDLSQSENSGLEGLFVRRSSSAATAEKCKDKKNSKSVAPPILPVKLRTPLTTGTTRPVPNASRAGKPPSPRSLRHLSEQNRQRGKKQDAVSESGSLEDGEVCSEDSATHARGKQQTSYHMLTASDLATTPEQKSERFLQVHGSDKAGKNIEGPEQYALTYDLLQTDSQSAAAAEDGSGPLYYMLTETAVNASAQAATSPCTSLQQANIEKAPTLPKFALERDGSQAADNEDEAADNEDDWQGLARGRTPTFGSPTASPRKIAPKVSTELLLDEIAEPHTPVRQLSSSPPGSPNPSISSPITSALPASPKMALTEERSPPSSPSNALEARQRALLRQARLREGVVQDRDYKRKHSRAAPRELEEPPNT